MNFQEGDIIKITNYRGISEREYPKGWLSTEHLYVINQIDRAYLCVQRTDLPPDTGWWIYEENVVKYEKKVNINRVNQIEID